MTNPRHFDLSRCTAMSLKMQRHKVAHKNRMWFYFFRWQSCDRQAHRTIRSVCDC